MLELLRRGQPFEGTRAKARKTTASAVLRTFIMACCGPRVLEEDSFVISLRAFFHEGRTAEAPLLSSKSCIV